MNDNLLRRIERGTTGTGDYCFGCKRLRFADSVCGNFGAWLCENIRDRPVGTIGNVGLLGGLSCDGPWRLCDGGWEYGD